MKKLYLVLILIGGLVVLNPSLFAYTIDGSVSDWGIDLNSAVNSGYLDSNLPTGGNVDSITEDNADINTSGWFNVGPGYTYNGNYFDAEAIYFDNDASNIYIAIVQGLDAGGHNNLLPGDIGIDIDGNPGYEFGLSTIDHGSFTAGMLYAAATWSAVKYSQHNISGPWNLTGGNEVNDNGLIDFVYSDTAINGHYVLEVSIPLSLLGLDANTASTLGVHWTQECGNDYLNLTADIDPVPEPATFLLFGIGLLPLIRRRMKKK